VLVLGGRVAEMVEARHSQRRSVATWFGTADADFDFSIAQRGGIWCSIAALTRFPQAAFPGSRGRQACAI
jgi:hypothetical protein